jgi:hypothetical protein
MSAVRLKLDTFTGPTIDATLTDACAVAERVGCWVDINVNGIDVMIAPGDRAQTIIANFLEARHRGATFVSANVIPSPIAGRAVLEQEGSP